MDGEEFSSHEENCYGDDQYGPNVSPRQIEQIVAVGHDWSPLSGSCVYCGDTDPQSLCARYAAQAGIGAHFKEPINLAPVTAPAKETCRCPIKNLLSNGHDDACPEKR